MDWRDWSDSDKRQLLERVRQRKTHSADIVVAQPVIEPDEDETQGRLVWPSRHVPNKFGQPAPFHIAQNIAWECELRLVAMIAGTAGGKTAFGPNWLEREIERLGRGDYLAVTSTYDLFDNAMLPALMRWFVTIKGIGRYWGGKRVIEIRDPETGEFWAEKSTDPMYARIVLRSAEKGGLEAFTAKAAWIDEGGQERFTIQAWRAINRRLAIWRGRTLITTTLYDLGWLVQQVVNRADGGVVSMETMSNGAEVVYTKNEKKNIGLIQFDSIINPDYSVEEYEDMRGSVPDDVFQMFWRGRVAGFRFLIYDYFVKHKFSKDKKKKQTCKRFKIPPTWERYMGIDFGGINTAAIYFAEHPNSLILYAYREYKEGKKTAAEHVELMMEGEPMMPYAVGGSKSEDQWRDEFAAGGLPINAPEIIDVELGISRVYGANKRREIIYFDDLEMMMDEKGRYTRERDKDGEPTKKIKNKAKFHLLDGERYIISDIRLGPESGDYDPDDELGTVDDVDNPWAY